VAITVRQLLDQPRVPLSLRAGAAGLDREVRWAHASDLADPWQYLARNEALLTNGTGMTADPEAQARFVARLERAGASALGYGLETGPPLSAEAVLEADRVGLPLFTLNRQARFSALAQLVAEANATHERRELQQVGHLYEILHGALAGQAGTEEVLAELGAEIGARMFLVDSRDGSPTSGSPATVFAPDVAAASAGSPELTPALIRLPPTALSEGRSAVMLPLDDQPSVALLVEAADHDLPSRTLLQHVATAVTIELAQLRATSREPQRSSVLSDLLTGRLGPGEAHERLTHHGLDPARCVLVAARRTAPPGAGPAAYLPVGGWSELRHVAAPGRGRCHVLVDCGPDPRLEGLAVSGWVVGVSSVLVDVERLPEATAQAQWHAATAELLGREVVTAGDCSTWPLPGDRRSALQAAGSTIGLLREHDAERGTAYATTIRVWLELDRSWQRAAAALAIHKQTLGYRLRRIEELSGRGLTSTEDLTIWWLGVRSDQLLRLADLWDSPPGQ
jgi:purine catabolism regulator